MLNHPLFLIIDGMSQAYRAYFAIRGLATSQGLPTNAVYGFAIMLKRVIEKYPPDYICVIGTTEDGRFPLVRQYRPAVEAVTWEFPSGTLEPGEEPANCARRELLEETGYISAGDTLLATLTTDIGRLGNRICRPCADS